jgi:hypothetical protein
MTTIFLLNNCRSALLLLLLLLLLLAPWESSWERHARGSSMLFMKVPVR